MSEETRGAAVEPSPERPESLSDLKPKMKLTGTVTRLELYGAFIDLGIGVNALIHISQLGKERVNRVAEVLNVGDEVTVWVDKVDPQREQVMVTMIEPLAVEWGELDKGQMYAGTVTRLENFGAFVDIGAEREGLVHISELSHEYVKQPGEVVKVGDEVQVQVLGYSKRKRRPFVTTGAAARPNTKKRKTTSCPPPWKLPYVRPWAKKPYPAAKRQQVARSGAGAKNCGHSRKRSSIAPSRYNKNAE